MQEQTLCTYDVGDNNLAEMREEEPLNIIHQGLGENIQEEFDILNHNEMDVGQEICEEVVLDHHSLQDMKVVNSSIFDEYNELDDSNDHYMAIEISVVSNVDEGEPIFYEYADEVEQQSVQFWIYFCSSNEPVFDKYSNDKEQISTSVHNEIFSIIHVYYRYEYEEGEYVKLISIVENEKESYLLHSSYNKKFKGEKVNQESGLNQHTFSSLGSALLSFDLLILRPTKQFSNLFQEGQLIPNKFLLQLSHVFSILFFSRMQGVYVTDQFLLWFH